MKTLLGSLSLLVALCCACGDDADDAAPKHDAGAVGGNERDDAVKQLSQSATFENGHNVKGEFPDSTSNEGGLLPPSSIQVGPGSITLLTFAVDRSDAGGDIDAVLVHVVGADRYCEVDVDKSMTGADGITLKLNLDSSVCDGVCNGKISITVEQAARLANGEIGPVSQFEVVLDCSVYERPDCKDGDIKKPPESYCETCEESMCVDLRSDPDHCGTCDVSCDRGQVCVLGKCSKCPSNDTCLCDSCSAAFGACLTEPACKALVDCAKAMKCSGYDCYNASKCKDVVDAYYETEGASGTGLAITQCMDTCAK